MNNGPSHNILVIMTGATVPPGLARAAMRNGWPILQGPVEPVQICRKLESDGPGVVLIHIPASNEVGLSLVRGFREAARSTTVVAIGAAGSDQDEILARAAGASLFLSESSDSELIERTVWTLRGLRADRGGPVAARRRTTQPNATAG